MFTRVKKDIVHDFINSHYAHVVDKIFLGRRVIIIRTEKLTASVSAANLDLLLIDNTKDKYYLLPWPKFLFKYIFIFCVTIGLLGISGGGWVLLFAIYIATKLTAMPILWDINLKSKNK